MRRLWIGLGLLGLAFAVATKVAEWTSEASWFAALGYEDVFRRLIQWRAASFAIGSALWAAILWSNAHLALFHIARRGEALELLGPSSTKGFPSEFGSAARLRRTFAVSFVALGAWLGGVAAANRFDVWMSFFGASATGEIDAASGRDLSFFLFVLPALEWAWNSFGLALALTWLGIAALYLSAELIETGPRLLRVAHRAAWHLSALAALLVVWLGVRHGLEILAAPVATGWTPNGIFGAPEARFGVAAHALVLGSSLIVGALGLMWAARGDSSRAFGLFGFWALFAALVPALAPSFGRSLRLDDQLGQKRALERHLNSTRRAWGLDAVKSRALAISGNATESPAPIVDETSNAPQTESNARRAQFSARFGGAPLWPASSVASLLTRLDSDSERRVARAHHYVENGRLVFNAVALKRGARDDAPAVFYQADAETSGSLSITARVPLDSVLLSEVETSDGRRPATAFGTAPPLAPIPTWRATTQSSAAVARDTFWPSLALAWRFFDARLLRPGPPVTWRLDPIERANALLPFVDWNGAVARPVLIESGAGPRLFWLVDGCFTSRHFPDSAALPASSMPSLANWRGVNYARQSVTAVFDATTGAASFYLLSPDEPLARVWKRAFPNVWQDAATLPPTLREALQISQPLADASAQVWSRYHPSPNASTSPNALTDEAATWAVGEDAWRALTPDIARSPWNTVRAPDSTAPVLSCAFASSTGRAGSVSSTGTLAAILWAENAWAPGQNVPQWQQWKLQQTLDLPELVNGAPTLIRRGRIELPNPSVVSFLPRAQTRAGDELLVVRGEIVPAPNAQTQALTRARFALFGTLPVPADGNDAALIVQLRELWTQLRDARRAGQWSEVARLEAALNALLQPVETEKPGASNELER